jgi:hypothetical protein
VQRLAEIREAELLDVAGRHIDALVCIIEGLRISAEVENLPGAHEALGCIINKLKDAKETM